MSEALKTLGIVFQEPILVEEYYNDLRGIFVKQLEQNSLRGMILDLDALPMKPVDFKGAVIKWLVSVNLIRLRRGQDPIVTLDLVLKCPIWKVIKPPLKRIELTKSGIFNKPSIKTIGKTSKIKSINK